MLLGFYFLHDTYSEIHLKDILIVQLPTNWFLFIAK